MFDLNNIYHKAELTKLVTADINNYSMTFDDGPRRHLGASLIGDVCPRRLWFLFRWMWREQFEARMLRLFQRGHREEAWLWGMLRACGWTILEVDPATGQQWRVSAVEGHFGGSLDAIGYPPPHYPIQEWMLLECKTNKSGENGKKWELLERGGITVEKPMHWAQSSTYGYLKGLRYGIYFNTNKDDDRMHIEPIIIDWNLGQRSIEKAEFVILSQAPPARIHNNMSMGECKWCKARKLCWHLDGVTSAINCRSCKFARPITEKRWYCDGWNCILTDETIARGCANWQELVH